MAGYVNSSKHKILTREEEIVLGRAVIEGQKAAKKLNDCFIEGITLDFPERRALNAAVKEGKRAKDNFVEHNLRLAMDTAAKYARSQSRMEYEDLIQEAHVVYPYRWYHINTRSNNRLDACCRQVRPR